jgi:hypothetical protein
MLDEIWKAAKLETHGAEGRSRMGWSALGLGLDGQESGEGDMFDGVGVQGLECLVSERREMILLLNILAALLRKARRGLVPSKSLLLLQQVPLTL